MEEVKKQLGVNLRLFRKKRGLTLDQVAEYTAVSKAMLGQIERGESNPTVGTIWKIANGLKLSFSSLLTQPAQKVSLIHSATIEPVKEDNGKYRVYPIFTFDPVRQWEYYKIELDPGCRYVSEAHGEEVEEYIVVTEGVLHLTLNNKQYTLSAGEAIRFKAANTHVYKNTTDSIAICQMIIHYQNA
ncbi:helix-turn-helix domain-containing protein [Jeotgalibacillus soli]|uniref:HTH cro/C1-type domain-containing protein n=1 Tax=Jeotgalibacillus soli TaxID=889306 RepID=A0A0C2V9J8_9BACL|nr:XRE family transcriptional regulator [Jeotgalibacillus soli]KIL45627.1 hypothetical protein KP78_19760 [Jeotgalibacillus soli]